MMEHYAHSLEGKPPLDWQLLQDHLRQTAILAEEFAAPFGVGKWAYLAGLWHDLGKYTEAFQRRIGATSEDAKAKAVKVDHATAGAIHAEKQLGAYGRLISYCIAGHHGGLPDWRSDESVGLKQRLERKHLLDEALSEEPPDDLLNRDAPKERPEKKPEPPLLIRMIFSSLVDADYLDTEAFMDPKRSDARYGYPSLSSLAPLLDAHLERLNSAAPRTPVNRIRADVLHQCLDAANRPPGLFSLDVPTGGGKTLSSMAFAMRHAVAHGKRRIIYVIPYTSIIEQTADVFRRIFGEAVLEHHSNVDVDDDDDDLSRARLASENWDAPIIVTTAVQFFESFFSNRSSRCRKLHNVADSVVILDEAQLLPPDFLKPILHLLEQLRRCFGVTFVLCTATQPALGRQVTPSFTFDGLEGIDEIIEDSASLHRELKRVEVVVPESLTSTTSWQELAEELQTHPSVLCVVNRRQDCRDLFELMPEGTFHLSALMCGAHRRDVIERIKESLAAGFPTRVISTQLVEAGVDLDFPVVYRALAGLDSIAQAAGRCNREGLKERGLVRVFCPERYAPPGHLRQAADVTRILLQEKPEELLEPELFARYFRELFWAKGESLDRHKILQLLKWENVLEFSFREAAHKFEIIDEGPRAPVLVRYGKGEELISRLRIEGPHRKLMRCLQRYVVSIPRYIHDRMVRSSDILGLEGHTGIFIQSHRAMYDEKVGFRMEGVDAYEPGELII